MSGGVPMDAEICREVIEMVRAAAGPEICVAIDESHRVDHWVGMTDEEIVSWIMGE
jgi:hypothetical protein